jgi:hypothetical protein
LSTKQLTANMWIYFWILHSVPSIYTSILGSVLYCFDSLSSILSFEIREFVFSKFVILFQNCLAVLDPLHFHIHFRISLLISKKKK